MMIFCTECSQVQLLVVSDTCQPEREARLLTLYASMVWLSSALRKNLDPSCE